MKKISVVIPCYNVENVIRRCADSALKQSIGVENMELIFINDASTDDTLERLMELKEQYPNTVQVLTNEKNCRMGITRNRGIQHASGEYIAFLDADDWILPEMYETLYRAAQHYQSEITGSHICRVSGESSFHARGRILPEERDYFIQIDTEGQRRKLLVEGMGAFANVNVCTKLYKRSFLVDNLLHFGKWYAFEDLYFSDLAAYYVTRFAVVQGEYYNYYVHEDSIMTSMDCARWIEQRQVMVQWVEVCREKGLLQRYYPETEFIFLRDYYISNLHFILTRGSVNEQEAKWLEESRKEMISLFPGVSDNPYLGEEGCLPEFQMQLLNYIDKPLRRGSLLRLQRQYCSDLIAAVKPENRTS